MSEENQTSMKNLDSETSRHELSDRSLFDRIASRYARKDLTRSSSVARALRLTQTLASINSLENFRILEVGCGAGFSPRYLGNRFVSYTGIDYSESLIAIARQTNSGANICFRSENLKTVEDTSGFDLIIAIGVLHHLDDIQGCLRQMRKLLKPGGVIAVNEPQSGNPFLGVLRSVRKRVDPEYSDDQCTLSRRSLADGLRDAGFQINLIRPQGFFSTPFAEVVLPLQSVSAKMAVLACSLDRHIERWIPNGLTWLSWNLVAVAVNPVA